MNNPYYNEDQAWMHPAQNAQTTHLQQLQTHWYEQQEADRQHQFYMHSTQADFAGLQNAAQQAAPHRHHHNGPGLGTMAAVGALGYMAGRSQQRPIQPAPVRLPGERGNLVGGWTLFAAVVLHLLSLSISPNPAVFWLVFGSLIWVPAWAIWWSEQRKVNEHNTKIRAAHDAAQKTTREPAPPGLAKYGQDRWRAN